MFQPIFLVLYYAITFSLNFPPPRFVIVNNHRFVIVNNHWFVPFFNLPWRPSKTISLPSFYMLLQLLDTVWLSSIKSVKSLMKIFCMVKYVRLHLHDTFICRNIRHMGKRIWFLHCILQKCQKSKKEKKEDIKERENNELVSIFAK